MEGVGNGKAAGLRRERTGSCWLVRELVQSVRAATFGSSKTDRRTHLRYGWAGVGMQAKCVCIVRISWKDKLFVVEKKDVG